MYVTLEPCAHQGRQPPCVEAILEAGIARVVIASDDPTEKAAGRGPGILRDGGVEVEFAAGERGDRGPPPQPALPQARPHRAAAGHPEAGDVARRPHRDRRPATRPGSPASASRALVHRWRAESDAIAVGIGTVLADDPLLTARASPTPASRSASSSTRQARLPLDSQLLRDPRPGRRSSSSSPRTPTRRASRRCATPAPRSSSPRTPRPIAAALADLGRRGITSLFLEGGRTLAAAFAAAGQIDESRTFVAPCCSAAPDRVARARAARTPAARRPRARRSPSVEPVGDDTLITARFKEW